MANPFQDKQNTTGGKAGFAAFKELQVDKSYDDETLKTNPGAPLPNPVANPPAEFTEGRDNVNRPDYEGIQVQKFKDFKKTAEAMDDILEREYIDPINEKKQQIVSIMATAFGGIPSSSPPTNVQLIASTGSAPDTGVAYQAGISTFVYATIPGTPDPTDVIGVRAEVFPDILAAYHYPALSNDDHGPNDLPLANGTFIKVSRTTTGSAYYSTNTLGIGQTVYQSGDNDYSGAVGVVTAQTTLGFVYFFGGSENSNGIGANINNLTSGAQSQISGLIDEIDDLRSNLRIRIGPPHVNNNAGINTLRQSKLQDELAVWYQEAGNRTTNISDFQGGMDALAGNATSISQYNG